MRVFINNRSEKELKLKSSSGDFDKNPTSEVDKGRKEVANVIGHTKGGKMCYENDDGEGLELYLDNGRVHFCARAYGGLKFRFIRRRLTGAVIAITCNVK